MARDEKKLFSRLSSLYESEAAKLDRDIAAYYQKYGTDNVIEYRRLLQTISDEDRTLLMERMDDFAANYPQYAHLMPVRESIYQLTELEAIQTQIKMQQLEIGAIEQGELKDHLDTQASRATSLAVEQMGYDLSSGSTAFQVLNTQVLETTVGNAWAQGRSYSDRLWDNKEKLTTYLNDDFAKLIARGVTYDQCVKELLTRFENVSNKDARRLIYTEGTFVFNEAQAQVHEKEYECFALSTCGDGKVCPVCRDIATTQKAHPVRFADRMTGVNFPPLHPWCRCSYTVEVADWDAWIDDYVADHGGDQLTPASLRSAKTDAGIPDLGLYAIDDKEQFKRALDYARAANKNGACVDTHEVSEMLDWKTFLARGDMAGVAVKQDGDITAVFKNSDTGVRRSVYDLILTARDNGGTKMDCYGIDLVNMYERCGYKVVARVEFNAEYVDDPYLLEKQPDVYFLYRTEESTADVVAKIADHSFYQSTQEQLDNLPTFDYDEAWDYRDKILASVI